MVLGRCVFGWGVLGVACAQLLAVPSGVGDSDVLPTPCGHEGETLHRPERQQDADGHRIFPVQAAPV